MVVLPMALSLAAASSARAEVGVAVDSFQPALKNPVILNGITDDPDPMVLWTPLSPSSPRIPLNPDGDANGDGKLSMIRNHVSGLPIVAWARNSATGFDIVVSHLAGVEWSEPVVVAGSPADELEPWLALDPEDGTVHLVWWVVDTPPRVMHRQAPADLSSWSAPVQVSQVQENACVPSAAVHDGLLRVVYEAHDLGMGLSPRQIVLATRDGSGFTHEGIATTWHAGKNRPEVHSAAGVLWIDWIDSGSEIAWIRRDPQTGVWQTIRTEPYASIEERDWLVRGGIRFRAWE
jgi:hypothetical protein